MIANQKLAAVLTEFPINTKNVFKDVYLFHFLDLSEGHKELDLQSGLIKNPKKFLFEIGPDFSFIVKEVELAWKVCYNKRKMSTSPYSLDLREKVIKYLC